MPESSEKDYLDTEKLITELESIFWDKKISPQVIYESSLWLINLLKPTSYVIHQQVKHSRILHSSHTVFMCFTFIPEQMATIAPHKINWLVFITELKSVYCAVRTGSLNKAVCASYLKG
jgi:hypothetical protein